VRSSRFILSPTAAAKKSEVRSSDGFFFDLQASALAVLCPDYLVLQIFVAEVLQAPKRERERERRGKKEKMAGGGREAYRNLLKTISKHVTAKTKNPEFSAFIREEFRRHAHLKEGDDEQHSIQQKHALARDYAFLVNSVHCPQGMNSKSKTLFFPSFPFLLSPPPPPSPLFSLVCS